MEVPPRKMTKSEVFLLVRAAEQTVKFEGGYTSLDDSLQEELAASFLSRVGWLEDLSFPQCPTKVYYRATAEGIRVVSELMPMFLEGVRLGP